MRHSTDRSVVSVANRLGLAFCAVVVTLLALFYARATAAALYASLATERVMQGRAGTATLKTAEIASQLAPWEAAGHSNRAKALAAAGETEAALAAFAQALRWKPADGALWRELARSRSRSGLFDRHTALALAQTHRLAPASRPIQLGNALDGVWFWRYGSEDIRAQWLQSMRFSLRHDRDRFLRQIAWAQREPYVCAYNGAQLGLGAWCGYAEGMRRLCAAPQLRPKQQRACRRSGFLPKTAR